MSSFIVVFKKGTAQDVVDVAAAQLEANGGEIENRYDGTVLLGFSAVVPETYMSTFETHPHIDYVEADKLVSLKGGDCSIL
ncbi:hypothetical protein BC828DRAFT_379035 [Blastocladiella britannica]|nr:hypothetical protein BC828DRAFT_379035 [Blastocladiella britannica]